MTNYKFPLDMNKVKSHNEKNVVVNFSDFTAPHLNKKKILLISRLRKRKLHLNMIY